MRAAVLAENEVEIRDMPPPKPSANEILVRVRACGLNRVDLYMAAGRKHGNLGGVGAIGGIEWAGEVVEVGSDVPNEFKLGDRVMCSGGGAFAEYAVADWGRVYPIPTDTMPFEEATTLPVALQTMHDALITRGRMEPGQSVLVQGASSGVGLMALQIAKYCGAGLVFGSSTDPGRRAQLKDFGADVAFDSRDPNWPSEIAKATNGKGIDVIIDQVSGNVASLNLDVAAIGARIVNVGRLGGAAATFNFELHALKRIEYIGVTFRSRTLTEVRDVTRKTRADLWDALAAGRLRLPIDRVFPLAEVSAALAHMRANGHFGKIVLTV
jgi:NADPH2:quinone reductase